MKRSGLFKQVKLIIICLVLIIAGFIIGLMYKTSKQDIPIANTAKIADKNTSRIDVNNNKEVDNKEKGERSKGVQLELVGVSEKNKAVFNKNFSTVKEYFDKLTKDRPDLQSAKMVYYADRNKVEFAYYYTPNPKDINTTYSNEMMEISLVYYNYIGQAISSYFSKCKTDLSNLGVYMEKPQIYICYYVNEDNYLTTYLQSQSVMLFGVKLPNKEIVEIKGGFASGVVKAAVARPNSTIGGNDSPENTLIEFFNQTVNGNKDIVNKNLNNSESQSHTISNTDTGDILYRNNEYGFSVKLPKSWEGQYKVEEVDGDSEIKKAINFYYIFDGNNSCFIFDIKIIKLSDEFFRIYHGSDFDSLGAKDGYIYESFQLMSLPEIIDDGNHEKERNMILKMVNGDLEQIRNSFEFLE